MKQKLSILLLALLLSCSASLFADNTALLSSAKKSYDKAEYENAINDYKKIVASGEVSSELYYNLGNAYYKNNEIGKAIYHYQLAHKLNPSDEDVKHNLTIANKRTVDQIEIKENYFAKNIESGILHIFSTTGWAWFGIVSLFLGMLFFVLFRISTRMRKLHFWLGSFSVLMCVISFVLGSFALAEITSHKNAIVLEKEVSALSMPVAESKEQFKLHEGAKVAVLESNTDWTSIQLDNGNEGWIETKNLGLY
ncbi:MAG: tetratricopeptide repeat protein [Bacteroidetes bacterium]|nr:tetratricopeptide repeat protein [Bacteroidota bacterium]